MKNNIANIILFQLILLLVLTGCDNRGDTEKTEYTSIGASIDNLEGNLIFQGRTYGIIKIGYQYWLDRNLGAESACEDYIGELDCWGDLYQWGRSADGHQKRNSSISTEISEISKPSHGNFIVVKIKDIMKISEANWCKNSNEIFWQLKNGNKNNVCPDGWRVPTMHDFKEVNISDAKDAFDKLKLSLAGYRVGIDKYHPGGEINALGVLGIYWTSSILNSGPLIQSFQIDRRSASKHAVSPKVDGLSVRCIKK